MVNDPEMEINQEKIIELSPNGNSPAEAVPARRARVFFIVSAVTCAVALSFVGGFLCAYFTISPTNTRDVFHDSDEEYQGTFQAGDPSAENRTTVDFTVKNTPSGQPNNFSVLVVVNSDKLFTFEYDVGSEQVNIDGGNHSLTASERITLEGELFQFLMSDLYLSHDLPPCCSVDDKQNNGGPEVVTEDNGEPEQVEQVVAENCNCTSTKAQRELNKKVLLKVIEVLAVSPGTGFGQRTYNLTDASLARRKLQGDFGNSRSCLKAGQSARGYFTDNRYGYGTRDTTKYSWRRTVGSDSCTGRCGSGCNCNWWYCDNDYMQDCFDHDLCLKFQREYTDRDYFWGPGDKHCGDEWDEAVDDYFATIWDYC